MTEPLADARSRDTAAFRLRAVPEDVDEMLRREGFTLGAWRVEPRRNRIVADDVVRSLDPRQIDVLVALAVQPGEVVTREELLARIWPDTYITENSLTQAISRLRKALGDDRREHCYIETISKSGYRLVAKVQWRADPEAPRVLASPDVPARARRSRAFVMAGIASLAAIALLAGIFFAGRGLRSVPRDAPAPSVRPAITLIGQQFDPRISPDGNYVAFAWEGSEGAGYDIWIQRIGGDAPTRITEHEHAERAPTWSPDGETVAFIRASTTGSECGVFRKPIIGGTAERLFDCMLGMNALDWSPDGRSIVFTASADGRRIRSLFVHDLETGERRRLTDPGDSTPGDGSPVFSPDGAWVAFRRVRSDSLHDVLVIPAAAADESATRVLTEDRWGSVRGVDWSRDGTSVIFSSSRTGRYLLWRVPVTGGALQRLPVIDSWVTQPSIARLSGRMIYRTFRDAVGIWELPLGEDTATASDPVVRVPSSRSERHPAWSPNGDAIAFVSDRSGSTELWSGTPDGTQLLRHTDLRGPLPGAPSWSPDGQHIVYDAAIDGHADLWTVPRDSRQSQRLTHADSEERNAVYAADGQSIYFASDRSGDWEIWQMPSAGGAATQLTTAGGFRALPAADGETIYVAKLDRPELWRLSLHGGEAAELLINIKLSDWASWAVGEAGIYYIRRTPTAIAHLPFGAQQPIAIYEPEKQVPYFEHALSLSTRGDALLFAMIDHSDDEVMVVENITF